MKYRAPLYALPTGITFDADAGFVGTAIDTTYSEPSTQVVLSDQGSAAANTTALQNAINAAAVASTGGTTIVIPAGVTYNGITLRSRGGDGGWIYLVSSARALLPAPQAGNVPGDPTHRVTVSDAAHMPKIVNIQGAGKAIDVEAAAHHYRVAGLEAATDPAVASFNLCFINLDVGMDNAANFPHHIGFDRCYLHGAPGRLDMQRAIYLNADNAFVVGCHISGVEHNGADAQAVLMGGTSGPFKICNNFMEATGENLMVGGTDAQVAGIVPSDIEIRGNHGYKPLTWNPYDPAWDGINRDIKNTWELKKGIRVLFEGNLAENCWSGQGAQYYVVNIKTTNQGGGDTWAETHDVTMAYNKFVNVFGGWSLAGHPEGFPVGSPCHNVDIYDNLLIHGDPATVGGTHATVAFNSTGPGFAFRHNTCVGPNAWSVFFTSGMSADVAIANNVFRRLTDWTGGGIKGDGAESPGPQNDGTDVFSVYTSSYSFVGNGFYDAAAGSSGKRATYTTAPSVNALIDSAEADVFANSANGNYRLAPGVFSGITTDGDPAGANIDLIDTAVLGGLTPPPQAGLTFVSVADGEELPPAGATKLLLTQQPVGFVSGVAHATPPAGVVAAASGATVTDDTSTVTASLVVESGAATPLGVLTAVAVAGLWSFAGKGLGATGSGARCHWHFADGSLAGVDSMSFTLTNPAIASKPFRSHRAALL